MMTKLRIILMVIGVMGLTGLRAQVFVSTAYEEPLTQAQVHDFLKTRIAEHYLQEKIQAREGEFNTLEREEIKVFYERRGVLLKNRGWSREEYEEVQKRIFAAKNAIQEYGAFEKRQIEHQEKVNQKEYSQEEERVRNAVQEMISGIEKNEILTEEQKQKAIADAQKMLANIEGMGEQLEEAQEEVNRVEEEGFLLSKPDWPAVEPYISKIEELVNWTSGSRENPPQVE